MPWEGPRRGAAARASGPLRAVVVGGGLAGVAAATVLAERGVAVTVLERERYLGGRLGAWTERLRGAGTVEMERGFHAFFRQYYNLRALLRRVDPALGRLVPLGDYPLLGADGSRASFAGLPRRPPFNVLAVAWRTLRGHLAALPRLGVGAALEMLAYDAERTHRVWGDASARDYLDALRVPGPVRRVLFDVFARSFFCAEDALAAGDLLMMFHCYFASNPEGLVFDVLDEPYSRALWDPLRRYLEGLGASFHLGCAATRVERAGPGRWRVLAGDAGGPFHADAVVLAMEVPALQALVARSADLDDGTFRAAVAGLRGAPPFAVWRLWMEGRAAPARAPFAATGGFGVLDNVSLYDRFEGESRRWASGGARAVVELHGYALPAQVDEGSVRGALRAQLEAVYPELRGARVLDERFLLRADCPAFPPGSYAHRPGPGTPFEGLAIAGDFVRLSFPCALMERAVASGFVAANGLLERWRIAPEALWSVPLRGLLAPGHVRGGVSRRRWSCSA